MPTEQEELRLTVSLVDNASAGLTKLREQITGLSSGQAKQAMESFQRSQKDMAEQIRQVAAAALGGEKAMLGFIARFGALGLAASAGVAAMKQISQGLTDIGNLSKRIGVGGAEIKNVTDQMARFGVSAQESTALIEGLTKAQVAWGRMGSAQYQELMRLAGPYIENMKANLRELQHTKDLGERINIVNRMRADIEKNRYEQDIKRGKDAGEAQRDAAQAGQEWLAHANISGETLVKVHGKLRALTAEQKQIYDAQIAAADNLTDEFNKAYASITKASTALSTMFSPGLVSLINNTATDIERIAAGADKLQKMLGGGGEQAPDTDPMGQASSWVWKKLLGEKDFNRVFPSSFNQRFGAWPEPPKMAGGGIVNRATMAMIGEAGPEAVVPLGRGGDMFGGEATKDNTRETSDNTKQLKELNDTLFAMLHPGGGVGGGGGGRGIGGGGGGSRGDGPSNGPSNGPSPNSDGPTPTSPFTTPGPGRPGPEDLAHQMPGTGPGGKFTLGDVQRGVLGGGGGDYGDKINPKLGGKGDPRGLEGYIRQTAAKYGVDPDVAVRVAQSEGLSSFLGDHGKSGGAFQLYTGGGLGNKFQKETELNPLDPKNEKATIDFALKHAAQSGWGPWHGAARVGIGPRQGIGGPQQAAENVPPGWHPTAMGAPTGGGAGAAASIPLQEGDDPGSGRGSGGRFNLPAGAHQQGQRETITLSNGQKVTVNARAAAQFQGFFNDLIKAGAPIHDLGGFGDRPYNPSQHPGGLAVDWAQGGRNKVSPDVYRWMMQHPDQMDAFERKWGMSGGEHWGKPDRGHFSIDTLFGRKHLAMINGQDQPAAAPSVSAQDRGAVDGAASTVHKVEATGKLTADITAPPGTKVGVERGGIFKKLEVNRKTQMSRAAMVGQAHPGGIGHA